MKEDLRLTLKPSRSRNDRESYCLVENSVAAGAQSTHIESLGGGASGALGTWGRVLEDVPGFARQKTEC